MIWKLILFIIITFYVILSIFLKHKFGKVEILDERELLLKYQVQYYTSKVVEWTLVLCTMVYLLRAFVFKAGNMETLLYLLVIGTAGNIAQLYAMYNTRKDALKQE